LPLLLAASGSLSDACLSVGSAQSAMQASQVYDAASMICLVLIAITFAAWYARPMAELCYSGHAGSSSLRGKGVLHQ
jgi:hypothetical protein